MTKGEGEKFVSLVPHSVISLGPQRISLFCRYFNLTLGRGLSTPLSFHVPLSLLRESKEKDTAEGLTASIGRSETLEVTNQRVEGQERTPGGMTEKKEGVQ